MHNSSLPPSDRNESPDPSVQDTLRTQIAGLGLSNAVIGRAIGKSSGLVSQWLNNKYTGDNASIETALREFLRDRHVARESGVETIDTEVSRLLCRKLEEVRLARELAIIVGPAGVGKSRGESLYLTTHVLAIAFRVRPWHSGMSGLADDLSRAAGIDRIKRGQKRWELIVEKTTGSDRLLIVDDAHELGPRALQCCVDYHEQTGNPVALVGLPVLKKKLLSDDRRARRVGDVCAIVHTLKGPQDQPVLDAKHRPLVEHLVNQLAPDVNGDRETLTQLCLQVAARAGAFGSVEKQLKTAAKIHRKTDAPWPAAFRAAHKRLLRSYTLN